MIKRFSGFQKIRWAILFIIAVGTAGLALVQRREAHGASLPVLGAVPEFSLMAEDGSTVTRGHLEGKIVVADFVFTHCAGTCPTMTLQMRYLQETLANNGDVLFISVSVDPERDTPERLLRYAKSVGARQGRWKFLTGEKTTIHQLARKGFHLGVEEDGGPEAEPIIHSSSFVLLDRQSRIRGYYNGTEHESVQKLVEDIQRLMGEE